MRRLIVGLAVLVLGAPLAHAQAVQVDFVAVVPEDVRRLGEHQQRRLRHDEQHDGALGRDVPQAVPERQDPDRGQGLGHGARCADRRHLPVRPDVAADEAAEIDQFEAKYGYKPTQIRTSYDALAVYVNKDNPLEKLTLAQVDAVFSKTRRRGGKNVNTWGDLGLTGDWASRPVSIYGRNSASGTYGFFKEHVLQTGDYRDTVKEQPGSASVVQGVTEDRFGIGYSGIGYKTSGVKALQLADKDAVLRRRLRQRHESASTRSPASCTSTSTGPRASRSTRS